MGAQRVSNYEIPDTEVTMTSTVAVESWQELAQAMFNPRANCPRHPITEHTNTHHTDSDKHTRARKKHPHTRTRSYATLMH
jgi:hypothetical protein